MKTIYYPNETRGKVDYGWLQANYSFSFSNFNDASREQFGKLRVLNDDIIAPSMGFGTHPHKNMEIVSIPLSGALAHKDSLGHESIINTGDVQVMSAGSGIKHSEYNPSKDSSTNLLQIWLFPDTPNVEPRYDQKFFEIEAEENSFITLVGPRDKVKGALWIHQEAYFNVATIHEGKTIEYQLRNENHMVYAFIIKGSASISENQLNEKDALGISETGKIEIKALENARVLLIETPK